METILKYVATGAGAVIGYLYGGWSPMLLLVCAFIVADYITGCMAAWTEGTLSSKIGFKRIPKKITIMIMIGIAHLVDITIGGDDSNTFMMAACFFYALNELISITENAIRMDVGIPPVFQKIINVLKDKGGLAQTNPPDEKTEVKEVDENAIQKPE